MKKLVCLVMVGLLVGAVQAAVLAFDDFDGGRSGFTSAWSGTQFGLVDSVDPTYLKSFQALGTSTNEYTSASNIPVLDVTGDATYYLSALYYATAEDQYSVLKFRNGTTPAGIPSILFRNSGWADAYTGTGSTMNEIDFLVNKLYLAVLKIDCNPTGTDDAIYLNMYNLTDGDVVPVAEPVVWQTDGFLGNTIANFEQTSANNIQVVGRGSMDSTFDNVILATEWLDVAALYTDVLKITIDENGSDSFNVMLDKDPNSYPVTVTISCTEPNVIDPTKAGEYDLIVSPKVLTFNAKNVPQTVTLTGVDNFVLDGDRSYCLILTDSDANDVVSPDAVLVTVVDDELPTVVLTGADNLVVAEAGVGGNPEQDTFTISISQPPLPGLDVVVTLTANATYLSLAPALATFTSVSYADVPITVTAANNTENNTAAVPYETYTMNISFAVTNAPAVGDAVVTIYEDDCGARGYNLYDADTDCDVDLADFAALAAEWLKCQFPNMGDACPVSP